MQMQSKDLIFDNKAEKTEQSHVLALNKRTESAAFCVKIKIMLCVNILC